MTTTRWKRPKYAIWSGHGHVKVVGVIEPPSWTKTRGKKYLVQNDGKPSIGTKEAWKHELRFITKRERDEWKKRQKAKKR